MYVDHGGTDILIHSINFSHCLIIDSNCVWLIDFYSSTSFFDVVVCFPYWFFSKHCWCCCDNFVVFALNQSDIRFSITYSITGPSLLFFISSWDINSEFSVLFDLTVPVAAIPLDFNNRKRLGLVKKLSITTW